MMETREERERIYREAAKALRAMVEERDRHVSESPVCGAEPLCIGPATLIDLSRTVFLDPLQSNLMIVVAVGELSRVARTLNIQRDLTRDMTRAYDSETKRADEAEREQQLLLAKLDETENRLSVALAELTVWEESADHIGPVGYPTIEP